MSKLLLFHQGALGDWVVTFPLLEQLKVRFPSIDAICPASHGELAVRLSLINTAIPVESAAVTTLFTQAPDPDLIKTIKDYDAVLLFSASRELRQTIGRAKPSHLLSLAPKPPVSRREHVTTYLANLLQQNGWLESDPLKKGHVEGATPPLPASHTGQPDRPSAVLLHPGSGSRVKNCPFEIFLETAALLTSQGHEVAFLLGPVEMDQTHWCDSLEARNLTYHRSQSLIDLFDRLKHAKAYIGNDSGPTHLAAYLGLPTVALFGVSDARRWHPSGPMVQVLEPTGACPPCFETESGHCSARTCFDHVSAPAVVAALETIL